MTLDSLVIRIGTIMHSKFDRISDAMTELIVQNETPLVSEELADMLASSVSGNLETVIQLLRNQIPVEEARPSTVAIRYAQLLADRGVSADQLRRAYHHGAEGGRREIFKIVRDLDCSADEKLQVLHHIDGFLHSYIDWISAEVLDAYEQEARRLTDFSATATATVIRDVLSGTPVPEARFESIAHYRLDQRHRASVMWVNQDSPAVDHTTDLQTQAQWIARGPGFTGTTLFTAVDREQRGCGSAWRAPTRSPRRRPFPRNCIHGYRGHRSASAPLSRVSQDSGHHTARLSLLNTWHASQVRTAPPQYATTIPELPWLPCSAPMYRRYGTG